jgi:integrase
MVSWRMVSNGSYESALAPFILFCSCYLTICGYCFAAAVADVTCVLKPAAINSPPFPPTKTALVRTMRCGASRHSNMMEKSGMQEGSVIREHRKCGPDVWCYRWRESGPSGNRVHRRIVLGTAEQLRDMSSARQMAIGLAREINARDIRMAGTSMTLVQLADHYCQRELGRSNARLSYSTKRAYQGYLYRWIVPRWGDYLLPEIKAVEVELWLKHLERAPGTCCKIRNMMSLLFNHARRYDLLDRNPIQWVRQSAKRRSAPDVLTSNEVRILLAALKPRERILVLLDVATGLRQSELFALKWKDVDFENRQLWVTRSIVLQVVGSCKTEASQKPVPLHDHLIRALRSWHRRTPYRTPESWVFASPQKRGKAPYWGQQLLRHHIRPAAKSVGIARQIGWHTFRRTYSTLLRATGAELKVMQELMRHSTIRVTLDTYTQAVTTEKRAAQTAVVSLLIDKKRGRRA